MDLTFLLQEKYLVGVVLPAGGLLGKMALDSIKKVINERADQTDKKVDGIKTTLAVHSVRLDGHDDDIVQLKVEGGWLRGRLGEPLDPKPPEA